MYRFRSTPSVINGIELNITIAAYDGCHKIYIPTEGQEEQFIKSMEQNGYIWDEDFMAFDNVQQLADTYINSCSLRFIEQVDYSGSEDAFTTIIPQCSFNDADGFFDEDMARAVFVSNHSP